MFVDCNSLPANFEQDADICIIGAGAAGITLANELKDSGARICLLESGDFGFDAATQALYDFENTGIPRKPAFQTRLRMFGGTTNHWDGRCGPLDAHDFERRDWVAHSGWPIARSDLDAFYARAASYCDLKTFPFDASIASGKGVALPHLDGTPLALHLWQYSAPTRFGTKYRNALAEAGQLIALYNANAVELICTQNSQHIERVNVKTLTGISGSVRARHYVLCCGGIDNARLLLCSNRAFADGIGNRHGVVGRYFMEHLRLRHSVVQLDGQYTLASVYNDYQWPEGNYLQGLKTKASFQRESKTLNSGYWFYYTGDESSPTQRLVRLLKRERLPDESLAHDLREIVGGNDEIYLNMRRRFLAPGSSTLSFPVAVMVTETEQAPNPESRITLSENRDALGMPKSRIHWQLSELDRYNTITATRTAARELARLYNIRVRAPSWMDNDWEDWQKSFVDVSHHMGTTRMSTDPAEGVVDKDCRVHGMQNLFVAGASVFPTSGHVNPTFTIVALAIRLADQLKTQLKAMS